IDTYAVLDMHKKEILCFILFPLSNKRMFFELQLGIPHTRKVLCDPAITQLSPILTFEKHTKVRGKTLDHLNFLAFLPSSKLGYSLSFFVLKLTKNQGKFTLPHVVHNEIALEKHTKRCLAIVVVIIFAFKWIYGIHTMIPWTHFIFLKKVKMHVLGQVKALHFFHLHVKLSKVFLQVVVLDLSHAVTITQYKFAVIWIYFGREGLTSHYWIDQINQIEIQEKQNIVRQFTFTNEGTPDHHCNMIQNYT
ncbi:hypothetical protein ACJX0J_005337, partial [Zea mays]